MVLESLAFIFGFSKYYHIAHSVLYTFIIFSRKTQPYACDIKSENINSYVVSKI